MTAGVSSTHTTKRAWGTPLARLDAKWTALEALLASVVLLAEIFALCAWISLKGLSAEYQVASQGEKNVSGLVFRGLVGAIVLGLVALRATAPRVAPTDPARQAAVVRQNVVVTIAVALGLACGRLWANGGVEYFENLLNWMQSASLADAHRRAAWRRHPAHALARPPGSLAGDGERQAHQHRRRDALPHAEDARPGGGPRAGSRPR